MAFDGLPQHFPTETNSFDPFYKPALTLEQGKLQNWRPKLGRSCVRPLPLTSPLKSTMLMARCTFDKHGDDNIFDIKYYGCVWEFSNQYWWQMRGEVRARRGNTRFDCTHYKK
jgi:hypothetical protein